MENLPDLNHEIELASYFPDEDGLYTVQHYPESIDLMKLLEENEIPIKWQGSLVIVDSSKNTTRPASFVIRGEYKERLFSCLSQALKELGG